MSAEIDEMTEYDWFSEGKKLEAKGEYEEAIKAYEESIKLKPDLAKSWFYKAILHFKLGQNDKAAECVKKALELKPSWEKMLKRDYPDFPM
jgi:tetratricopeptide (TPR) repeat protein